MVANDDEIAVAACPLNVLAYMFAACISPPTPTPPDTINAPDAVFVAEVVFVIIIVLLVDAPKSVTSCKSCNDGPGSYVGSDCNIHDPTDALI